MLELGRRGYVVLSDSDDPAIEQQRAFKGEGIWVRYDELVKGHVAVTSEDFIAEDAFTKPLAKIILERPGIAPFPEDGFKSKKGRIAALTIWLESSGVSKEETKNILNQIKESVFGELKLSQIEPQYYLMLKELAKRVPK